MARENLRGRTDLGTLLNIPSWCCMHDPAAVYGIVAGDALHVGAYLFFGSALIYWIRRATIPVIVALKPLAFWTGAFVVSCGLTHLAGILAGVVSPAFCQVEAVTKLISGGISLGTLAQAFNNRHALRDLIGAV